MEKDYLPTDVLMDVEFSQTSSPTTHQHENFELLYVLEGTLQLTIEQDHYELKPKDIVIINDNRQHAYQVSSDTLVARFLISYGKLKELLDKYTIIFWCNSAIEESSLYDETRHMLDKILNCYVVEGEKKSLNKTSLYYQLINLLVRNFLLSADDVRYQSDGGSESDRMQQIFQYIRTNYRHPITLQDLADHFFLSTTYLSKYIKQHFDVGFIDILNNIRLSHAMVDLLHTEQSVMKIAMDNGFASVAAFNKVFKEVYDTTPSKFRKEKKNEQALHAAEGTASDPLLEKIGHYLLDAEADTASGNADSLTVEVDAKQPPVGHWDGQFSALINMGSASDLIKADFQEQILFMKKHLGIKYVRLWDIYDPKLHLDIGTASQQLNFSRLDTAIDFLVNNDMIPYIELGFKPMRLMKTANLSLFEEDRQTDFSSDEDMRDFFKKFLKHYIYRFGIEEVEKWYFEYWKKLKVTVVEGKYILDLQEEEGHAAYFHRFSILAETFRAFLPDVKIGGGGFPIQHYRKDQLKELFQQWLAQKQLPSFLTFTGYPYQIEKENQFYYERRVSDSHYLKNRLAIVQEALEEAAFPSLPLHVTEYGLTLSNRNPINDHSAKAAFLIKNGLLTYPYADLFGYYLATDLYNDFFDSQHFLFGGSGLLSKTGVAKPAFYAIQFLNALFPDIYAVHHHYIVTRNKSNAFRIVCHNLRQLSASYYLMAEEQVTAANLPRLFEDNEEVEYHIQLKHVPNGCYSLKTRLVNEGAGSVQHEWKQYDQESDLSLNELDYFKRTSTPRLLQGKISVTDHVLDCTIRLKPNEIRYLELNLM